MKLTLLLLLSLQLAAADSALNGTVTAASTGAASPRPVPISGARLTLTGPRLSLSTTTDSQGRYELLAVPTGLSLHAVVEAPGFQPAARDLHLSGPLTLDFSLPLASRRDSVVVEGGLLSVRSDAPEQSQTISSTQLEELPVNGRRLLRFALLDPHVRQAIGLGADGNDSYRLSINGGSYRHTAYLLDGDINYDWYLAVAPQQPVSIGAVEQMKVLSGQYAAEFGTSTSGVLSVFTKSGSDRFHGEAIGFLRPSGIQAQAPLATFGSPRIPNEREQWGASLGGPLHLRPFRAGCTQFFANYEGNYQQRGAFIQSPTPNFFTGKIQEQYALVKIDHRLNDHSWITWRANGHLFDGNNVNDYVSGFNQPNFGRVARLQSHGSQLTWHTLAGPLLNELRVSYASYFPNTAFPLQSGVGISRPSYSVEGNSTNSWAHVRNYSAGDVAAIRLGAHQWKFGINYLRQFVKDYAYTPFGTYTFAAGPPTLGQNPLRFAQTFGITNLKYGQTVASGFLQDDWRLSSRLSLNLGLRYENQSVTQDRNNFAPRLGLAWDLNGSGRTVVRAGAGVFYDQFYLYIYRRFYSLDPYAPTASYTIPFGDPAFPVFPNSLAAPPTGISSGRRDILLKPDKIYNPYSLQYTLALERQLGHGFTLSLNGLHSHVLKLMRIDDINHPAPFLRTTPGQSRTAAQADLSRPFTTYKGVPVRFVAVVQNAASSLYDSFTLALAKTSRRYRLDLHYTAASSSLYTSFYGDANGGVPNEWNNWGSAERGPSDFHQRHRATANGSLNLPYGFRFIATGIFATGLPVNPLTGTDNNGDGYSADRPAGFGRNSFRGPHQVQIDTAIQKTIRVNERLRLDLRTEFYNLINRNNYINVNNVYGDTAAPRATFLQPIAGVTNTDPSRQIQFALRLWF